MEWGLGSSLHSGSFFGFKVYGPLCGFGFRVPYKKDFKQMQRKHFFAAGTSVMPGKEGPLTWQLACNDGTIRVPFFFVWGGGGGVRGGFGVRVQGLGFRV